MRKWAYLKVPYRCNDRDIVYKIMIYETKDEGVYLFEYLSRDAQMCTYDSNYAKLSDALKCWENEIDESGWHPLDDPLPGCIVHAFLPLRRKRDKKGKVLWDQLEILKHGKWVDYTPE